MAKSKKAKGKKKVSSRAKSLRSRRKNKATKKVKAKVTAIPKGYASVTPYLIVHNANDALAFYKNIFGAKEVMRMERDQGKVAHAEIKIGDSKVMLADEFPDMEAHGPQTVGGTPVSIHLYMKNVDGVVDQAVQAGAKLLRPVETMFYGDRCGAIEDPFGHKWFIATHVEDVTPAQMKKRAKEMFCKE